MSDCADRGSHRFGALGRCQECGVTRDEIVGERLAAMAETQTRLMQEQRDLLIAIRNSLAQIASDIELMRKNL